MKLTHAEFMKKFNKTGNSNVEILGQYDGVGVPLLCRCLHCGREWFTTSRSLLYGRGCARCVNGSPEARYMDFTRKLLEVGDSNIEVLSVVGGRFTTTEKSKIECKCRECGRVWTVRASTLLGGSGCRPCSRSKRYFTQDCLKHEGFIKIISEKGDPSIDVIGTYYGDSKKVECKCLKCNNKWKEYPANLINQARGCSVCKRKSDHRHEKFITKLNSVTIDFKITSQYAGRNSKVDYKCRICGFKNSVAASSLLNGHGCPRCASSKGERGVGQFLDDNGIENLSQVVFEGCRDKDYLVFDFLVPEVDLLIEYDGEQHFRPVRFGGISEERASANLVVTKRHDEIKNEWASDNGYNLLRISYKDKKRIGPILSAKLGIKS